MTQGRPPEKEQQMFATNMIDNARLAAGLRARSVRRLGSIAAAVVTLLALAAVVAGTASAAVATDGSAATNSGVYRESGADLVCSAGQFTVYAPHFTGVYSTFANTSVYISTYLQRWDGTMFVDVGATGEWAYGVTDNLGRIITSASFGWISTGLLSLRNGQLFNNTSPWITFTGASGYYRVWTRLRDAADNEVAWVLHWTPGGYKSYCLA